MNKGRHEAMIEGLAKASGCKVEVIQDEMARWRQRGQSDLYNVYCILCIVYCILYC